MILGLDVSTSITGITLLDDDGEVALNEYVDLRKCGSFFEKVEKLKERLEQVESETEDLMLNVFIEESLQAFRPGYSSAKTLLTLAKFNGIVAWLCKEIFGVEPEYIAATSARKLCGISVPKGQKGKDVVMQFMLDNHGWFVVDYTKFGNIQTYCYDKADSWVVAKAGLTQCQNKTK